MLQYCMLKYWRALARPNNNRKCFVLRYYCVLYVNCFVEIRNISPVLRHDQTTRSIQNQHFRQPAGCVQRIPQTIHLCHARVVVVLRCPSNKTIILSSNTFDTREHYFASVWANLALLKRSFITIKGCLVNLFDKISQPFHTFVHIIDTNSIPLQYHVAVSVTPKVTLYP